MNSRITKRMKQILIIFCLGLMSQLANAQVATYTVGTGGNYTSLYAAFDDINNGVITGDITLQITSNLVELNTCVIDYSGFGGSYSKILIYPTAPNLSITGNLATGHLIDFNGADNVTIDGRVNATGSTQSLTIKHTAASAALKSTIYLRNSSTFNKIQYCEIACMASDVTPILFEGATNAIGNSNNMIANNTIAGGNTSTTKSSFGLVSELSNNFNNINDSIINNNILNINNRGISLKIGTSGWYISGNSLYDSISADVNARTYFGIRLDEKNSQALLPPIITNNFIGGSAPNCNGNPFSMISTVVGLKVFVGISINWGWGQPAIIIKENTIQNISVSRHGQGELTCIASRGSVSITNNIIGGAYGSIQSLLGDGATFPNMVGIYAEDAVSCVINNNQISGFLTTANIGGSTRINGIICKGPNATDSLEIKNNIIGSSTVPNSIHNNVQTYQIGTTTGLEIEINFNGTALIENNTIININSNSQNFSKTTGINVKSGGKQTTVKTNSISDITGALEIVGIRLLGPKGSLGRNIINNTISNLQTVYTGTIATNIIGISAIQSNIGLLQVERNFIHSLTSANVNSITAGISSQNADSNSNIKNNIVSLTSSMGKLWGISMNINNKPNVLHNTVYINSGVGNDSLSACLYLDGTLPDTITNNIFYNSNMNTAGITKNHYCVYNKSNNSFVMIDYNDYRVVNTSSGGATGYMNSTAISYSNLAQWRTITGQDLNSININPLFLNPGGTTAVSYYPQASVIGNSAIVTDYFNSNRVTNQWMGALQSQMPLPLTWKSFEATKENYGTLLRWITSSELNTSYFEVEKSTDTKSWKKIATVTAAGNTETEESYTAKDEETVYGMNYYRIKSVDMDGQFTYSSVEQVFVEQSNHISIYPNPVMNTLYIKLNTNAENTLIEIYSLDGKKQLSENTSQAKHAINVEHLQKGTYMIRISTKETTYTSKFVRQ